MQPKILSRLMPLIFTFLGLTLSAALFLYIISKNLIQGSSAFFVENVAVPSNQEPAGAGLTIRLKIPGIGVDSAVIPVGLTSDGAMDVPKSPAEVAWFNLGPRPGENGSAVIAGHYDWKNNIPAAFNDLDKLGAGDKIFIVDEKGVAMSFAVREIRTYRKDEAVPDVFSSSDGKAHLNLITCTGVWNKEEKTYSDRLVVFTDKE